jgi:hypothetical protein
MVAKSAFLSQPPETGPQIAPLQADVVLQQVALLQPTFLHVVSDAVARTLLPRSQAYVAEQKPVYTQHVSWLQPFTLQSIVSGCGFR